MLFVCIDDTVCSRFLDYSFESISKYIRRKYLFYSNGETLLFEWIFLTLFGVAILFIIVIIEFICRENVSM